MEPLPTLPLITPHMVGNEIRKLRLAAQLTQADLASAANVSRQWISKLENGHPGAELFRLMSVVRALGTVLLMPPNHHLET